MGKVKRLRQKYHLSRNESEKKNSNEDDTNLNSHKDSLNQNVISSDFIFPENIFEGINISSEQLNQKLKDDDVRSILTAKSTKSLYKNQNLKKKDKRLLRREAFLKKIDFLKQFKEDAIKKKKRDKTVITGDLNPLLEALPSQEELTKKDDNKKKTKLRGILKAKHRQKKNLEDISFLKQMFTNKDYKKNSLEIITKIVQERVNQENS